MESVYHVNHSCKRCWYMYPTNKNLTNENGYRCHCGGYCNAYCENCKHDCKKTSHRWCERFELKEKERYV
jgi:hypothetical protein